jgi:P27 family predicted phage terminase small subunit
MGRKRVPDWMRVVDGNRRPGGRAGKSKRPPKTKGTPAPDHLSEGAQKTWTMWEPMLREMGAFRPEYSVALEEACELRTEILDLRKELQLNGRYYTTQNREGHTMRRPHPASGQLADAQRRLATYLSEFGLTPVGRARLLAGGSGIVKPPKSKDQRDRDKAEDFFSA